MIKRKDYLVDVSASHKYRNQSEEYQRLYHKWRTDKSNPFGYSFVHDTRLHTYVDGEGYLDETPAENERQALINCYRLTGFTLLLMIAVAVVRYIVLSLGFELKNGGRTFYSELHKAGTIKDTAAYAIMVLNLLEYIFPIIFLKAATRMPSKIAVPLKKSKVSTTNAVMMMLVLMAVGKLINSLSSELLAVGKIDLPYYDYINATSPSAIIICGLAQHVIVSILIEVIFRGYLLQIFRQFGDSFAVIITSLAGCFMLYDLSQMAYLLCVGIFTGMVTIRSGSIKNACMMRIIARGSNYLITFFSMQLGEFGGRVLQISFCLAIFVGSIIVYIKLNNRRSWSFETEDTGTSLNRGEKIRLLFLNPFFWIWVVSAFVVSLMMVKTL